MPKLSEKIWSAVFNEFYDRREFDWWWDGIDNVTKGEIRKAMVGIIEKLLDENERYGVREVNYEQ